MKKILLISIVLVIIYIIGCGGSAVMIDSPEITMVVMHETSVTVTWAADTSIENHGDFQGYNIYVYTDSSELLVEDGEDLNKDNAAVIPPDYDHFNYYGITDLSQDSVFYIQVRTVNIDNKVGDYNDSVPFVKASPRPEFTVTLKFEMIQPGVDDSCAIKFSDATIMADSAMTSGGADMWVEYRGSSPNDTVIFTSPDNHSEFGTDARHTGFVNLGQHLFYDISGVITEPTENYVSIVDDDLIIAKTADGNYVKIYVDEVDKSNNFVTIIYAYQNIVDFPYF